MGVKKSTVCTRARFRSRRYTPASSKVFELTSTFRSNEMGSCGKTCRRACWLNLEAHPAQDESEVSLRICSRDIEVHLLSPVTAVAVALWATRAFRTAKRLHELQKKTGEDRNRTYLATCVATTVLKTARATRHPSLSGKKKTSNVQRPTSNTELQKPVSNYFAFLIALTMASKSGQSPVSSLEWSSLPLARISKAPPLEGISVSDLMRSPSSRILAAKLTAFGV